MHLNETTMEKVQDVIESTYLSKDPEKWTLSTSIGTTHQNIGTGFHLQYEEHDRVSTQLCTNIILAYEKMQLTACNRSI